MTITCESAIPTMSSTEEQRQLMSCHVPTTSCALILIKVFGKPLSIVEQQLVTAITRKGMGRIKTNHLGTIVTCVVANASFDRVTLANELMSDVKSLTLGTTVIAA